MSATLASPKEKSAATAHVAAKLAGTIGDNIDLMWALREKKRELEAKIKEVEGEISGIEEALMEQLAGQGVAAAKGSKATASITTAVVAAIEDWDALCKYIKRSGHFHLFQRRVSDPAFRELLESKGAVPGLSPFTKRKLNLKSL